MPGIDVRHPDEQLGLWDAHANDERGVLATQWEELNAYLHRGGLTPGTFVLLGGRTGTRKTTIALNLVVGFLRASRCVGLIGLDEPPFAYVAKIASIISGVPHLQLEEDWDTAEARAARQAYMELTHDRGRLVMASGYRPGVDDLAAWREMAEVAEGGLMPDVLVIDYLGLLAREGYPYREVERIPRLAEDLQVFANEHEVIVLVVHQVGRLEEGSNVRYHGDKPMTPEHLRYGGEEIADLVLGCYRPAKDPLGGLEYQEARDLLGERFTEDKYAAARRRVQRYERSTFLQLLKNRPGTRTNERGIELLSPNDSMLMHPAALRVNEDMVLEVPYG